MENTTEQEYIKELCEGNKKAFEVLFLRYQPKLIFFLTGFIKDEEQSRDIAEDVFLDIWRNRERLGHVKSFKAYIFRMAKNSICNYYDHLIVTEKFVAQEMLRPSSVENTEEIIFANQLQAMIDVAVNEMPPQRKQIYLMSRVDGLNNVEIAEKLNISKRTVENHLTAALADLRKVVKLCVMLFSVI